MFSITKRQVQSYHRTENIICILYIISNALYNKATTFRIYTDKILYPKYLTCAFQSLQSAIAKKMKRWMQLIDNNVLQPRKKSLLFNHFFRLIGH